MAGNLVKVFRRVDGKAQDGIAFVFQGKIFKQSFLGGNDFQRILIWGLELSSCITMFSH
jgi:hypothetical protein